MIGNVKIMNGCATLGGWWTDLQKALQSGAMTAAQLLGLYQQGRITEEQYYELQKIQAEAAGKATQTESKTPLYVAGGVAALLLVVLLTQRN